MSTKHHFYFLKIYTCTTIQMILKTFLILLVSQIYNKLYESDKTITLLQKMIFQI